MQARVTLTSREQADIAFVNEDQLMMLHCIAELLDDIRVELKRNTRISELIAVGRTPSEIRRILRGG